MGYHADALRRQQEAELLGPSCSLTDLFVREAIHEVLHERLSPLGAPSPPAQWLLRQLPALRARVVAPRARR